MGNPFTLAFGKSPLENIDRPVQKSELLESFLATPINQQIYLITGVRGSGKTMLMTDVSRRLRKEGNHIARERSQPPRADQPGAAASSFMLHKLCLCVLFREILRRPLFYIAVVIYGEYVQIHGFGDLTRDAPQRDLRADPI